MSKLSKLQVPTSASSSRPSSLSCSRAAWKQERVVHAVLKGHVPMQSRDARSLSDVAGSYEGLTGIPSG
jgi:hypothetical protein